MATWKSSAIYRDASGEIAAAIENNGSCLRLTVDDIVFEGQDFDCLEPRSTAPVRFTLAYDSLCACELQFSIPVIVGTESKDISTQLDVLLALGPPRALPRGGIEFEKLSLRLEFASSIYSSSGGSGWFEDELVNIQKQLPPGCFLKMCFGCGLSDYHPAGHGLFGSMGCFRTRKEAYRALSNLQAGDIKSGLFEIWDDRIERVQETFLCDEFETRGPNTGYRG